MQILDVKKVIIDVYGYKAKFDQAGEVNIELNDGIVTIKVIEKDAQLEEK